MFKKQKKGKTLNMDLYHPIPILCDHDWFCGHFGVYYADCLFVFGMNIWLRWMHSWVNIREDHKCTGQLTEFREFP